MTRAEALARKALRILAGDPPRRGRVCANGCAAPVVAHRCAWKIWLCPACAARRCRICGKRSLAHWMAWVEVGGKAHAHRYTGWGNSYGKIATCGRARGRGVGALRGFHGGGSRCKTCVRLTTAGRMSI